MVALPRVFGPFELLKGLGSGATGEVFLARPLDITRGWPALVVVKRMHFALNTQPEQQARFQHEARLALALSTPHVPKIHVVGEEGGTSYIAMDFVAGWTLSRVMKSRKHVKRPISIASMVDVVKGVLNGLIALHEAKDPTTGRPLDALHRDLAPKNIMLGEDGVTRLIDLGLGKSTIQQWQTSTGVVMGTPGYMAPEQVLAGQMDVRTDLYTVGIVLWELLAGESFIPRSTTHRMLREQAKGEYRPPSPPNPVPPAIESIVKQALSVEPGDRFPSARQFLADLEHAAKELPAGEGPVNEMVTAELWEELAAAQSEYIDLTEPFAPFLEDATMPPSGPRPPGSEPSQPAEPTVTELPTDSGRDETVTGEKVDVAARGRADQLAARRRADPLAARGRADPLAARGRADPLAARGRADSLAAQPRDAGADPDIDDVEVGSESKTIPQQIVDPALMERKASAVREAAAEAEASDWSDGRPTEPERPAHSGDYRRIAWGRSILMVVAVASIGTLLGIGGVLLQRVIQEVPVKSKTADPPTSATNAKTE